MPEFLHYFIKHVSVFTCKLMLNDMDIDNLTIEHKINQNVGVNLTHPARKQCMQKVHRYMLNMPKLAFGGSNELFKLKFWSKWYGANSQQSGVKTTDITDIYYFWYFKSWNHLPVLKTWLGVRRRTTFERRRHRVGCPREVTMERGCFYVC